MHHFAKSQPIVEKGSLKRFCFPHLDLAIITIVLQKRIKFDKYKAKSHRIHWKWKRVGWWVGRKEGEEWGIFIVIQFLEENSGYDF